MIFADSDDRALVGAAQRRDGPERDALVRAYLPRIAGIARDYRGARAVNREELTQSGVLGLLCALERYDADRGNKFWTYAQWWVRRAMQELVSALNNPVVFSDRALRQLARVNAARRDHVQSQGSEPSPADLAAITGLKPTQIAMLIGAAQQPQSLDDRSDPDLGHTRATIDTLSDPAAEDPFEHATLRAASRSLHAVLATLDPRERVIVGGRFGIDGDPRSLRDLAAELRVSPERARQIEQVAMRKLRASCDATPVAA